MIIRITEHTTTDDTYCLVEDLDTGRGDLFYGTYDAAEAALKKVFPLAEFEIVWS
jgi:hypothetical protein